jgi:hypothetical protein
MVHKMKKYPLDKEGLVKMLEDKPKGLKSIELKWVTPEQFLAKVPEIDIRHFKGKSIDRLSERIQKGKPLDPLYFDVRDGKVLHHEGRHRALVSKVLGVEKIPVLYYHIK